MNRGTCKVLLLAALVVVVCRGGQNTSTVVPRDAADGYFINPENYRQFCNSNEDLLKGKPRGIVVEFPGLGGGSCLGGRQDPMGSYTNSWSKFPETTAAAGLVHVYLMPGPWSWMNPGAVREADLVVDALRAKFGLAEGSPLVAAGGSMGGLGALVFTAQSRHRVTACAAACPCYDALAHYHCKPSFARTYVAAVAPRTEKSIVEGLKEISPVHLLPKMPDIPYFIVCDCDDEIFPEAGMDDYVAKLRARASRVTYEKLPGQKHGGFTPECRARLHDFVCQAPAQTDAVSSEGTVTVRPAATDEVLDNPGMGLYGYQYSNRLWAYGSRLKPGDTMDWFPGVNVVYFRVPWCELEPAEGDYRWDVIDSVAQNWIAKGKKIAIRVTCCENRYKYPTPKWVFDAGAKATEYSMYENFYQYWKVRSETWSKELLYEPDYTDPIFLQKLENFLKAFARRYDGNPSVAFCDIGTFGMWGEGHTDYTSRMSPEKTLEAVKVHMALWRKCLPNTYLVISDDVSGWASLEEDPPAMKYARELGIGFRDDSIMVEAPSDTRKHANGRPLASWYHDNWARIFAKTSPVVVEHEHYDLSRSRKNCWNDEWLVKAVEAYEASYLSVHGWPDEIYEKSGAAFRRAALRLGYRFELRQASYPKTVRLGEPFEIKSEWANVGVARCYAGANVAWSLIDGNGAVVWTSVDERTDFKDAQPKLADGEHLFAVTSRVRCGCTSELPDRNDGVITYYRRQNRFPFGKKVPTMACGTYTLAVSLGRPDGTPTIALPLRGGDAHRRYPVGTITVTERVCEPNFSFVYRGVEHHGIPAGWTTKVERKQDVDGGRDFVTTRAVEPGTGFELTLVETCYRDLPVSEWEVSFENHGTNDSGRLTRISSVDWNVPLADEGRQLWHGTGETDNKHADRNYAFEKVAITNGMEMAWQAREGYPSYFAFPYFRLSDKSGGYTVALGYQGQWAGRLSCRGEQVNLRAGQQTVDFFLKPGESAIAPKITVLGFRDADDVVNGWRRFMRRYALPRAKDGRGPIRPILAGGHHEGGCLFVQTTEKGQIDAIRRLAAAGIYPDTWWIDAGWYTRTSKCSAELLKDPLVWYRTAGDWTADPERLPNGFKPIADELAKHGGNLTLWFEPERLWGTNPFMEKAKPYLTPVGHGGSWRYDLSRSDVVAFLGKYIGDQFDYNDVGIYRQDSNGPGPLPYWQSREKEIGDGRHGFVENMAVRGEFALWSEWLRRRPHMLFDTCASGGRRNDLSTLRFPSVPLHYSDTSYGDPVAKQRHYHFMNEWLFYHKNNSGHFHRGGVFNRRIAVSQLAQFYHFKDAHLLDGDTKADLEYLGFWRRLAPLTIDGDYYLLTPEVFGEDRWWVTEFFDPAKGEGFLQVVRNPKSQENVCRVTLKGLKPGTKVQCEDLYAHRTFEVVSGNPIDLSLNSDDGTFIVFRYF